MKGRKYISSCKLGILMIFLNLPGHVSCAQEKPSQVEEIIVVCKTHFDIGYTHRVDELISYDLPLPYDAKVTDVPSHSNSLANGPANPGELTITFPSEMIISRAQPVNLRGQKTGDPIPVRGGKMSFKLGEYAPVSFILK